MVPLPVCIGKGALSPFLSTCISVVIAKRITSTFLDPP